MQGIVSFHPVDLEFFDSVVSPLVAGQKINPDPFLEACIRHRAVCHQTERFTRALEGLLELLEPPPHPTEGKLWDKVRSRLERFDFKPDPLAALVGEKVEPELHLRGRPFLIAEGSADRVAALVDEYRDAGGHGDVNSLITEQLVRFDPGLGGKVEPVEIGELSADMIYRRELLGELRELYELAQAARGDQPFGPPGGPREPAADLLPRELPWRAVCLYSRSVPFWIGRDVDGLETVCRAAGLDPPEVLTPAWRLFTSACEEFPRLREALGFELKQARDVGAFVSFSDLPELLSFLNAEGSRIIGVATQHGEGPTCATLLRKIRECLQYAERHGMGYLEASGIPPLVPTVEDAGP